MPDQTQAIRQLAHDIHRCELLTAALGDRREPCRAVVSWQGLDPNAERYVPEPWAGHIGSAPILFISSNPSAGPQDQPFDPRRQRGSRASDEDLFLASDGAFDPGPWPGIVDGIYNRDQNGKRIGKDVRYWSWARTRARELLERSPDPGGDYALTEVVHCGSRHEHGVKKALPPCTSRYLRRIVSVTGALVIVLTGQKALPAAEHELGIQLTNKVWGPDELVGAERYVIWLPHFQERGVEKGLVGNLGEQRAELVRAFLRNSTRRQNPGALGGTSVSDR